MAEMKERHRLELASLQEEHESEKRRMTDAHDKSKSSKRDNAKVTQAKADYQSELEDLAAQHKRALDQQTARQNRALEQSRREFEAQKAEIDTSISELDVKRSELESTLSALETAKAQLAAAKTQLATKTTSREEPVELTRKSKRSRSPFLSFASFIPASFPPREAKVKRVRLCQSIATCFAANPRASLLSMARFYVADSPPQNHPQQFQQSSMLFPFQESRFPGAFSRISEIPPQAQEADRVTKSRELNYKLRKVHGKIDATAGGLGTTLKDSMEQMAKSCQGIKALASEQSKVITQLTFDFQQQTGQLSRTFQNAVGDVEASFRAALSFLSSARQFPILAPHAPVYQPSPAYPPPDYAPHAARPKRVTQRRIESDVEDDQDHGETPAEGSLRRYRREQRKSRADRTRIAQQFQQLKQKIRDD
jgi:hypothetical protein